MCFAMTSLSGAHTTIDMRTRYTHARSVNTEWKQRLETGTECVLRSQDEPHVRSIYRLFPWYSKTQRISKSILHSPQNFSTWRNFIVCRNCGETKRIYGEKNKNEKSLITNNHPLAKLDGKRRRLREEEKKTQAHTTMKILKIFTFDFISHFFSLLSDSYFRFRCFRYSMHIQIC